MQSPDRMSCTAKVAFAAADAVTTLKVRTHARTHARAQA